MGEKSNVFQRFGRWTATSWLTNPLGLGVKDRGPVLETGKTYRLIDPDTRKKRKLLLLEFVPVNNMTDTETVQVEAVVRYLDDESEEQVPLDWILIEGPFRPNDRQQITLWAIFLSVILPISFKDELFHAIPILFILSAVTICTIMLRKQRVDGLGWGGMALVFIVELVFPNQYSAPLLFALMAGTIYFTVQYMRGHMRAGQKVEISWLLNILRWNPRGRPK